MSYDSFRFDFKDGKLQSLDTSVWVEWRSSQQEDQMSNTRNQKVLEDSQHEQSQVRNNQDISSRQAENDHLKEKKGWALIIFNYFEKPMSSNMVVQARSALSAL